MRHPERNETAIRVILNGTKCSEGSLGQTIRSFAYAQDDMQERTICMIYIHPMGAMSDPSLTLRITYVSYSR
ncbi:MAG: hypothetical protein ACOYIF_05600 [Acetivibrionales bacterium]